MENNRKQSTRAQVTEVLEQSEPEKFLTGKGGRDRHKEKVRGYSILWSCPTDPVAAIPRWVHMGSQVCIQGRGFSNGCCGVFL